MYEKHYKDTCYKLVHKRALFWEKTKLLTVHNQSLEPSISKLKDAFSSCLVVLLTIIIVRLNHVIIAISHIATNSTSSVKKNTLFTHLTVNLLLNSFFDF